MIFSAVWAYNEKNKRFEYDCKWYVRDNDFYWVHNNKFFRTLDDIEIQKINEYKVLLNQNQS
jgi:hypothetical protein